jgi:3D (Asp-Asp-Asp) domain-containing protein
MRVFIVAVALCVSVATAVEAADSSARRARRTQPMRVTATAYCHGGRTQSGVRTHTGIISGDPLVLPIGSVVRILDGSETGTYTVMDTGSAIKGRRIDVYVPSCARAKRFGRRTLRVQVVRLKPDATGR